MYKKSLEREIKIFTETGQRSDVYEKYVEQIPILKAEEMLVESEENYFTKLTLPFNQP